MVVLTGCFVDSHRDALEKTGPTFVVPNDQKHAIFDLVEAHRRGEVLQPTGSVFDFPVPSRIFHSRSMLKVQDGCDNYCTFCIIPFVRGRAISRPAVDVLRSAREAVAAGTRELILTGVNMSRYRDEGLGFADLVDQLLRIDGDFRLRISSLEPDQLDDRFVALFDHPKMTPHLHLCLQSASERVLLAMRRQYTYAEYHSVVDQLRAIHPKFNITTDIIVGFPGETEAEFGESLQAIEELEFGHVHTFPYSERDGTRAARMPGSVPQRIRTERASIVREVASTAKVRYRTRLHGDTVRLLVEQVGTEGHQTVLRGFGEHYVPIRATVGEEASTRNSPVREDAASRWKDQFVEVHITGTRVEGRDSTDPVVTGTVADQ